MIKPKDLVALKLMYSQYALRRIDAPPYMLDANLGPFLVVSVHPYSPYRRPDTIYKQNEVLVALLDTKGTLHDFIIAHDVFVELFVAA